MKQILNKLFLFGILGSFVLLYSCGDDDTEIVLDPPTIDFTIVSGATVNDDKTEVTGTAGEEIVWNFTVTAPSGFNTFRIEGLANQFERSREDLDLEEGATVANINGIVTTFSSSTTATLTLTAVSEDNQVTTASVLVIIESAPAEVRTAVLLAAPLGNDESETFYSVSEARTYSNSDVLTTAANISGNIDFGYYYGQTSNASLSSPSGYPSNIYDLSPWGTRNSTAMVLNPITSAEYLELDQVSEVQAELDDVDFAGAATTLTNLAVGDIVAIRTAGSMEGFVRVVSVTGTDGADGRVELEMILNKEAESEED
ncbi:MAG: hypothetical protein WBA74_14980 [Cyclobacteriaceae bacterium]